MPIKRWLDKQDVVYPHKTGLPTPWPLPRNPQPHLTPRDSFNKPISGPQAPGVVCRALQGDTAELRACRACEEGREDTGPNKVSSASSSYT